MGVSAKILHFREFLSATTWVIVCFYRDICRDIYRDIYRDILSFDIHERLRGCGNAVFGKGLWLVKLLQCT